MVLTGREDVPLPPPEAEASTHKSAPAKPQQKPTSMKIRPSFMDNKSSTCVQVHDVRNACKLFFLFFLGAHRFDFSMMWACGLHQSSFPDHRSPSAKGVTDIPHKGIISSGVLLER